MSSNKVLNLLLKLALNILGVSRSEILEQNRKNKHERYYLSAKLTTKDIPADIKENKAGRLFTLDYR